jgi:hypothetical protein
VVQSYGEGAFPERQYRTKLMRHWCGARARIRGESFTKLVVERIRESGWAIGKVDAELTELLGCRNDPKFGDLRQFGDVDVTAWNETSKRVLLIECKHLHFHRTHGEVAEQLTDYRGRKRRDGKADDLLKHLNRLEIASERRVQLFKHLGISGGHQIEGWIIFRNAVPMLFCWNGLETKIRIATFDDIPRLLST